MRVGKKSSLRAKQDVFDHSETDRQTHRYGHRGTKDGGRMESIYLSVLLHCLYVLLPPWTRGTRRYSVMSISLLVAACACATLSRSLAASIFSSASSAASAATFIS